MGRFFNEPWRCGNVGKFTDFYMFVHLHVLLFLVQSWGTIKWPGANGPLSMIGILFTDAGKPIFIGPGNLGPVGLGSLMHACKTSKLLEHGGKRMKARARPLGKISLANHHHRQNRLQCNMTCCVCYPPTQQALFQVSSQVCAVSSQASIQGLALGPLTHVKLPSTISTFWLDNFTGLTCSVSFFGAHLQPGRQADDTQL